MAIEKVAVIGSGVMGSGIAAQVANAGLPVVLLDIKVEGKDLAADAVAKMLKTDPAPFMHKKNAKLITTGTIDDNIDMIADCDWIIEVVLEKLEIKHATYEKIIAHKKKDAIVSSNTSTIPLKLLAEPFDKDFKSKFMITHFFNPPRYMRLLELVTSADTDKKAVETIRDICDIKLGKGVVVCNDTPGFIANRIGTYWLQAGINEAIKGNVPIEVADAVLSKPVGIPKTGVFALIDLVGIDLMPKLADSLLSTLPKDDPYRDIAEDYAFVHQMIEAGYTGRKGKGGFYRLNPDKPGAKEKQALRLDAKKFDEGRYELADRPKLESVDAGRKGLRAVVETDDQGGDYAWKVLSQTLAYAASLVPQIADTITDVDEAMKLGYNWKFGPFEMIDALGPKWFADKLAAEGKAAPDLLSKVGDGTFYKIESGKAHFFGTDGKYHEIVRPEGVLLLRDIKLASEPVIKTASAAVWDIGDGVLCFEFTGKMNALDDQVFDAYQKSIKLIGDGSGDYKALVIHNEGTHFSAGANLGLAMFAANIALWPQIQALVDGGQKVYQQLKHAPFPVVSAPSGMALGGGCEILLHSDHVQAHAETYCGLVEVGVGVLPAWGGCKEMILRYMAEEQDNYDKATGGKTLWFSPKNTPMGAVRKAFELIAMATVAKSAQEAKQYKYLKDTDGITMNRDRLLFDAKQKALELAKDYKAPEKVEDIRLPGPGGKMALDLAVDDLRTSGKATPYDVVVSESVARVLTGDQADWTQPVSEDHILKLEREEFMKLVKNNGTMDRIEHMLTTGKPLRN